MKLTAIKDEEIVITETVTSDEVTNHFPEIIERIRIEKYGNTSEVEIKIN